MIYHVVMYGDGDNKVAEAFVEAPSSEEAYPLALRLMRKEYPNIDPQKYNQTLTSETLYRTIDFDSMP